MTRNDALKEIIKVYKNTNKKLKDVKKIQIDGDEMINVDVDKTLKAMFYQEVDEIFRRLRNGK
jgi:hypothetical protein